MLLKVTIAIGIGLYCFEIKQTELYKINIMYQSKIHDDYMMIPDMTRHH